MGWKCYSCGTDNAKTEAVCTTCGNTVAAPKSFYVHWIAGAAVFFAIFYLAGTLAGGVLVEAAANPSEDSILKVANEQRKEGVSEHKSISSLEFEEQAAAKAVAIAKAKAKMSSVVKSLIQWVLPIILFIICGIIVGFVSTGVTIIEAGIGSILGQAVAVALLIYVFKNESISWIVFGICIIPGAGLGILGAWLGEIFQARKEQAGGITG